MLARLLLGEQQGWPSIRNEPAAVSYTHLAQLKAKEVQFLDSQNGIGNQIAVLSFTISLEVVGLYHAWLEQAQE